MKTARLALAVILALSGLIAIQGVSVPAMARGGDTGVGWEHHEEGDGYYRKPSGEGPGQGDDGEERYWPPNKDGYFEKTEVGFEKLGDVFVWRCKPEEAKSPNMGDTFDGTCERASGYLYCPQEPGVRPIMPYVTLLQHKNWHKVPGETKEKPLVKYDGKWNSKSFGPCKEIPDDDWVSSEEISKAAVDYKVFQQLGEPNIKLAPGARGYVNLPVVVSADYLAGDLEGPGEIVSRDPLRVRVPIEVERPGENLTGEITATAKFSWTFKGGEPSSGSGQGKPYTSSVDPVHESGYYVKTTYHTKGTKQIQLNVRWTGEVQVDGLDPEPIPAIEIPAETAELPISELDPILGR